MTTLEVWKAVRDTLRLRDSSGTPRLCRFSLAQDRHGFACSPLNAEAVRFSLLGAFYRVQHQHQVPWATIYTALEVLRPHSREQFRTVNELAMWEDSLPPSSFLRAVDETIERLEKVGGTDGAQV